VRNDVPAAVPLIFLIAGLSAAPLVTGTRAAIAGLLVIATLTLALRSLTPERRTRWAGALLLAAIGGFLFERLEGQRVREEAAFAAIHPERFVVLEAPMQYDWAPRETSFVMRSSHFTADGVRFDTPIAVYARFEPPEIAMEATLRAEGFLRRNDRGAYTFSIKSPRLMSYEGSLAWWHPAAWNRALANRLEPHAEQYPDEVALAQALLLGRGERLTDEMRDSFRRGGTYHLLVFSALQIAFAAGVLAALLRWLHAPRASDWLLLGFAAIAPLFIGPTASVSRASVGIGLYALSRIAQRPTSVENLWCVAAMIRLIIEPRDLTDVSFHLTYAGAGALLFIGKPWRLPRPGDLRRRRTTILQHAAAAEIAIAPLTLFHFHQYAIGGSLLTLAMSPLIFAMLVASSVACLWPGRPVFLAITLLHRLCGVINSLGLSGFYAAPPLAALLLGGIGTLIAIALLRGRSRAVAIALALLVPSTAAVMRGAARRSVPHPLVSVLDVGQGDAILVRSGRSSVVIDGGRGRQILRLLAERGVRRIDAVALSHAHPDHCDGLVPLIENFEVGSVWVSPRRFHGECATRIIQACINSRTPIRMIRDGDILAAGDIRMTAHLASYTFRQSPENNASLVLHLEAGGRRFLFTGDMEKEAELYFADRDLRSDVLKVGHHGSRTSTSRALLDAVQPRIGLISCGRRNLFGHPHPTVLAALEARGIRTWRTDLAGSLEVEVREGRLYVVPKWE
jgi:competence protein ComEC